MCGIAGFIDPTGFSAEAAQSAGTAMSDVLTHRGPDTAGIWLDQRAGVTLVHRRLAVVDLSAAGEQPMESASGRYVVVLNGEIYNHKDLREELEKLGWNPPWRGHSDTETLLACIDCFGLHTTLKKLVGMFAFAIYDKKEKNVFLARDRVGEKPVYFGHQGQRYFFASELKAIRAHPAFEPVVNRDAICLFLRHNYIPAPFSIYRDIQKLQPGCWIKLAQGEKPQSYWSFDEMLLTSCSSKMTGSDADILDQLDDQIGEAIGLQMQADVPLGAFLSGGIDSSLIVAMMQERSARQIKTFSIGFEDASFDESPYAKAVANHIGTEHHDLCVTARQAHDAIPKLSELYDEPFADSSQIPTFLLCQMARQHVTVSLSGDAGDELFGGYNRYSSGATIWRHLSSVPMPIRYAFAHFLRCVSPNIWNTILSPLHFALPRRFRHTNVGDKIHKLADIFPSSDLMAVYSGFISHWKLPQDVVLGGLEPPVISNLMDHSIHLVEPEARMMYLDTLSYLPDDILVKVDRAAMGTSLETRVPFLDHRVVEMAWNLPSNMKIRSGVGKWCLRELLYRRVPKKLIERPKMGFGVPLGDWLRGELRGWAEHLLSEQRLSESGYFDPAPIRAKWEQHLSGKLNWHHHIWDILMFESWRDNSGI